MVCKKIIKKKMKKFVLKTYKFGQYIPPLQFSYNIIAYDIFIIKAFMFFIRNSTGQSIEKVESLIEDGEPKAH